MIQVFTRVATWCFISIMVIGLACIYSSTACTPAKHLWHKQAWGIALGICIYLVCASIPAHYVRQIGVYGFYIACALLLITTIRGSIGMGAQRWLQIGGFTFQPSEILKVSMPFFIIDYLHDRPEILRQRKVRSYLLLIAIICAVCFCVLKQPDLGTAIVLFSANIALIWLAGLPTRCIVYALLICIICAPAIWYTIKPYQQERILVFLGAGSSYKERYHLEQSRIAIGSGGMWGKGWQNGTQNQLRFLPERRTDFIFSVLCEEFGLMGALSLLILYAMLFTSFLAPIQTIQSITPQLLIIGLALPHLISAIINIAMVMGLLPIVGIPLPLMSYGLSHLWTTCASFGSILSVTDKWMYR